MKFLANATFNVPGGGVAHKGQTIETDDKGVIDFLSSAGTSFFKFATPIDTPKKAESKPKPKPKKKKVEKEISPEDIKK